MPPERVFLDYYRILEVNPTASLQEIRRSFRRLVLKVHPDKNPERTEWSERKIRQLIEAYEVIGDDEKRRRFDVEYRLRSRGASPPQQPREKDFFFFKKSDPNACAHRILYFLLHERGDEAIPLLLRLESRRGPGFLRDELDRSDYLDCLFLLGEYHLRKREYREALGRLRAFYIHERNTRYPRHYLDAVVAHLKDLYLRKLPQVLPPQEALSLLEEAIDLNLGKKEQSIFAALSEKLRARSSGNGVEPKAVRGEDASRRKGA
jgi:curved DNA-binding protein CbpA